MIDMVVDREGLVLQFVVIIEHPETLAVDLPPKHVDNDVAGQVHRQTVVEGHVIGRRRDDLIAGQARHPIAKGESEGAVDLGLTDIGSVRRAGEMHGNRDGLRL